MDRMQVSGACDPGSIPGGSTKSGAILCSRRNCACAQFRQESKVGAMPKASETGSGAVYFQEAIATMEITDSWPNFLVGAQNDLKKSRGQTGFSLCTSRIF